MVMLQRGGISRGPDGDGCDQPGEAKRGQRDEGRIPLSSGPARVQRVDHEGMAMPPA